MALRGTAFEKLALPTPRTFPALVRKRVAFIIRMLRRAGIRGRIHGTEIANEVVSNFPQTTPDGSPTGPLGEAIAKTVGKRLKPLGDRAVNAVRRGLRKKASSEEEQKVRDRTIGQGLGSAVSNFATGYALTPVLYNKGKSPRPPGTSWLRHHYHWRDALLPAIALSAGSLVGGAIKQNVADRYEQAAEKRRKKASLASGVSSGFAKRAAQLVLYTRHPSERPTADAPKPSAGFAQVFGNRFSPSHSQFRHAARTSEAWMGENSELVDLGNRPNMVAATREVLGIEPGKPISRAEVLRILNERSDFAREAVTRRRMSVIKGRPEAGADSPNDVREMIDALGTVVKHPRVRFIELQERS